MRGRVTVPGHFDAKGRKETFRLGALRPQWVIKSSISKPKYLLPAHPPSPFPLLLPDGNLLSPRQSILHTAARLKPFRRPWMPVGGRLHNPRFHCLPTFPDPPSHSQAPPGSPSFQFFPPGEFLGVLPRRLFRSNHPSDNSSAINHTAQGNSPDLKNQVLLPSTLQYFSCCPSSLAPQFNDLCIYSLN